MIYRHLRRGTTYRLITRCPLTCQGSVAEGMVLKMVVGVDNSMRIMPEMNCHYDYEGLWARGELQSDTPLPAGTILVCYQETSGSNIFWFRPENEFDDGRFVEVPE
jgi:hypothetical protein